MSTQVSVIENGVQVEVAGTLPVTAAQLAALNAADAPSAANAFATMADVPVALPLLIPVTSDWTSPANCLADLEAALALTVARQPGEVIVASLLWESSDGRHATDNAALRVDSSGATYRVNWTYGRPAAGSTIWLTAIAAFDPALAGEVADGIAAHVAEVDPHGDRAYSDAALTAHLTNQDDHAASVVSYESNGNLGARDVNGAIDELDANHLDHVSNAAAHPEIKSGVIKPYDGSALPALIWNNQGSSTRHDYPDHVAIKPQITGNTSVYGMRCLEAEVAGGDGDFTITGAVFTLASTVGTHVAGIYVRNGSIVYNALMLGHVTVRCESRASVSASGTPTLIAQFSVSSPVQPSWFKIERAGTALNFYASIDGQTWALYGTVAVGTDTFTHCGFFGEQRVVSGWSVAQCDSFKIE